MSAAKLWDEVAAGWQAWWPVLERGGGKVSARLVELAGVRQGDRVLDLATGGGEPALTAARVAGDRGSVIGLDASPGMLGFARQRAEKSGIRNVTFREESLETFSFPKESFDAALCRWGLMFTENLQGVLSRTREVLKKGKRFAFAVWSTPDKVTMMSIGVEEIKNFCGPMERPPGFPDPTRLSDSRLVNDALGKAGFQEIAFEKMIVGYEWESAEAFSRFRKEVSPPFRLLLGKHPPEMQKTILDLLTDTARKHARPDGTIYLQNETICYSARA